MAVDTPPMHPKIPGWFGQRGWSPDGEPPTTLISFSTDGDAEPFKITHGRDMIYDGAALQQDYNFIDYYFGDEADPITARHYLRDPEAMIDLPQSAGNASSVDEARTLIDPAILAYFQRRFRQISVMTAEGYEPLWRIDNIGRTPE
jgi:hypothetical protein